MNPLSLVEIILHVVRQMTGKRPTCCLQVSAAALWEMRPVRSNRKSSSRSCCLSVYSKGKCQLKKLKQLLLHRAASSVALWINGW